MMLEAVINCSIWRKWRPTEYLWFILSVYLEGWERGILSRSMLLLSSSSDAASGDWVIFLFLFWFWLPCLGRDWWSSSSFWVLKQVWFFFIVHCEEFVGFADCFFGRGTGSVAVAIGEGLEAMEEQVEIRAGIELKCSVTATTMPT